MRRPEAVFFDLDETLAPSFQAADAEITKLLSRLLDLMPVAIITGADFERIEWEVLKRMPRITSNLYLFPNSSSQCYVYDGKRWQVAYNHLLTDKERERIREALAECTKELGIIAETKPFGERIVDRQAQVAFTVLGVDAPPEVKRAWDPDGAKRQVIARALHEKLDGFDVLIGGASTIDITRRDVNKAYGVRWLGAQLGFRPEEMLYVGDALYEGGNDAVVITTGIRTITVSGPGETLKVLADLVGQFRS